MFGLFGSNLNYPGGGMSPQLQSAIASLRPMPQGGEQMQPLGMFKAPQQQPNMGSPQMQPLGMPYNAPHNFQTYAAGQMPMRPANSLFGVKSVLGS